MNQDLTQGKPETILWKFCLPLFGSILFQQLYNLADSWVAGKFIGENALAAVGNSYEITLIFIAFAFGCNMGCSIICAKLFGAKKMEEMKTALSTAMIFSGILCLILMIGGFLSTSFLFEVIHTPKEILHDSIIYLQIYLLSLPFVFFYNIACGIFSALGDSKTPFYFLVLSSLSNIAMDILFVATFQMGVAGVAWATYLCQGVSCFLALKALLKRVKAIPTTKHFPLFSFELLQDILHIAIPSILQQSFISLGNILIQGIINSFGAGVIAGYSASIKLNNLVITSLTTLSNGISNYTAQNLGAEKTLRVQEGFHVGLKMVWMLCIPLTLLYFTQSEKLIYFFLDEPSSFAIFSGTQFLKIVSPFYFIVATKLVADGILKGAGQMKPFMVATFTDLILRVILAKLLSLPFQSSGIWCAWPIGWLVATILSLYFYKSWFSQNNDLHE